MAKDMQTPVNASTAIKAPAKAGANGAAWAEMLIRWATERGEAQEKEAGARKMRLAELKALTREDRVAVLARFGERQQEMNAMAVSLGVSLRDYLAGNTVERSVYTETSLWKKLCKACDTGWTPNLDLPWNILVMEATDRMNAVAARAEAKRQKEAKKNGTAKPEETPTVASSVTRKVGRSRKPVTQAVQEVVKEFAGRMPETQRKEGHMIADIVETLLSDPAVTLREVQEVAAVVQRVMDAKVAASKATDAALAKAKNTLQTSLSDKPGQEQGETAKPASRKVSKKHSERARA
jgi:hypothetical protein